MKCVALAIIGSLAVATALSGIPNPGEWNNFNFHSGTGITIGDSIEAQKRETTRVGLDKIAKISAEGDTIRNTIAQENNKGNFVAKVGAAIVNTGSSANIAANGVKRFGEEVRMAVSDKSRNFAERNVKGIPLKPEAVARLEIRDKPALNSNAPLQSANSGVPSREKIGVGFRAQTEKGIGFVRTAANVKDVTLTGQKPTITEVAGQTSTFPKAEAIVKTNLATQTLDRTRAEINTKEVAKTEIEDVTRVQPQSRKLSAATNAVETIAETSVGAVTNAGTRMEKYTEGRLNPVKDSIIDSYYFPEDYYYDKDETDLGEFWIETDSGTGTRLRAGLESGYGGIANQDTEDSIRAGIGTKPMSETRIEASFGPDKRNRYEPERGNSNGNDENAAIKAIQDTIERIRAKYGGENKRKFDEESKLGPKPLPGDENHPGFGAKTLLKLATSRKNIDENIRAGTKANQRISAEILAGIGPDPDSKSSYEPDKRISDQNDKDTDNESIPQVKNKTHKGNASKASQNTSEEFNIRPGTNSNKKFVDEATSQDDVEVEKEAYNQTDSESDVKINAINNNESKSQSRIAGTVEVSTKINLKSVSKSNANASVKTVPTSEDSSDSENENDSGEDNKNTPENTSKNAGDKSCKDDNVNDGVGKTKEIQINSYFIPDTRFGLLKYGLETGNTFPGYGGNYKDYQNLRVLFEPDNGYSGYVTNYEDLKDLRIMYEPGLSLPMYIDSSRPVSNRRRYGYGRYFGHEKDNAYRYGTNKGIGTNYDQELRRGYFGRLVKSVPEISSRPNSNQRRLRHGPRRWTRLYREENLNGRPVRIQAGNKWSLPLQRLTKQTPFIFKK